jgi:prophage regulatory protein
VQGVRLISGRQMEALTSLSQRHFKRLGATGKAPLPVQLSEKRVAWVEDEVLAFNAARVAERDAATPPATAAGNPAPVAAPTPSVTAAKRSTGRTAAPADEPPVRRHQARRRQGGRQVSR